MIESIGIVGAGQMGNGIAHVCALAEHTVQLFDISQAQLDRSLTTVATNLDRQLKRRSVTSHHMV